MPLHEKKVILAICGSIAAYKSVSLCRLLIKSGAEVKVIMTNTAQDFVGSITFASLSKHPVISSIHDEGTWNNHVSLGLWADLIVVAPATANTLAHFANGHCDNIVDAVYLSARCPILFAPAMDLDMWNHPATRANITTLKKNGNIEISVNDGELASGLSGPGRMAEPEEILEKITQFFTPKELFDKSTLAGKTALITAGPTYENLDPVRFIGNYSTGRMGIEIAKVLAERNVSVHLILGPSVLDISQLPSNIIVTRIHSANEMLAQATTIADNSDIMIFSAAVADYRPAVTAEQKIKKSGEKILLELVKNPDIASTLSKVKKKNQITIGFALETNQEVENAKEKLVKKNLDLIVLNSLQDEGAGFGNTTNKVSIFSKNEKLIESPLMDKQEIAKIIVEEIEKLYLHN